MKFLRLLTLLMFVGIASAQIPSTFFGMSDSSASNPPAVSYGTLGHPVRGGWESIEQSSGVFDFSYFDNYLKFAPKDGTNTAQVILTLSKTPPWALPITGTSSCTTSPAGITGCTAPPDHISDWITFISTLINHYNGTTAPHIKYYEIWNEADGTTYYTGTVAQLVALAQAAYPLIKADPHAFVVSPSMVGYAQTTSSIATSYLNNYLSAGGNSYTDVVAFHGYIAAQTVTPYPLPTADCGAPSHCFGTLINQVTSYRSVMSSNSLGSAPLINTEGGFYSTSVTDADTAAAWLAQYYLLQGSEFSTNKLSHATWWIWGGANCAGCPQSGPTTPSIVGIAFTQLYNWLVGTTISSVCTNAGNIWSCLITKSGYQALAVWDASQTCSAGVCTTGSYTVPSGGYTQYRTIGGTLVPISGSTIQLGLKPLLLENTNVTVPVPQLTILGVGE